ncbi:MAG: NAD-dependent epimerase/dehydratase family protein [Acidimicrobiia bacterium]
MKVAVTGGSGVVGAAVVRMLTAGGYEEVRALARSAESRKQFEGLGAVPVPGDLLDTGSLQLLVAGCEIVFNIAGINQMCVRHTSLMHRVNVDGVSAVVEASRRAGVRRLVHTSSAVTIGERKGQVGNEESEHRGFFLSGYERTKFLGEQRLFAGAGDLEVVAVNPSSVQGPGRATGTGKLILDVVNGRLRCLIDSPISLVDIDDCARGHVLAAGRGEPGGRYILSGGTLTVREAVRIAADASGRELDPRFVPGPLVTALAAVAEPAARLAGRNLPYCKEMVRVMRFGHRYDGSRASSALGLEYRPVAETIARTISWFAAEGLLDS